VVTIESQEVATSDFKKRTGCLLAFVISIFVFVGGIVVFSILAITHSSETALKENERSYIGPTQVPLATQVSIPSPIPTQSFASLATTFGSSGIGPGLLNDARYIAVDGSSRVYVADYQDGRIQAFDSDGKFLHGWQVGDAKTIIYGLTASLAGTVYVSYKGDIYRFEGSSGKALGKLDYENGQEFGDLVALPDGGVLGAWYQERWGIITSLEGHRDDLVWFDAEGKTTQKLESAISGQTGDTALDNILAVDGLGNVYVLSEYDKVVFKFTSQGKFVDRIELTSSDPHQSIWINCIAVDGQGRVYIGGSNQVYIFSPEGQYLLSFETKHSVWKMAFSVPGDLYTTSGDSVSRYTLGELP
jgi:DNA-binding beta-propeller fold protein YncE